MNMLQEVISDYFTKQESAAIDFFVGVPQGTANTFIGTRDANGFDGDKVIAESIKRSAAGIEPSQHLLPITF
jgi:hypothetical protein